MNVIERIDAIMKKQGLSDYQLSKISGLSSSTISNMRRRHTIPSIPTLEHICGSLNLSLSQFFADDASTMYPVTPEQKQFLDIYVQLSKEQQNLICELAQQLVNKTDE